MKAVTYTRYGPPDVLTLADRPKPEPGPGEILIEVHATTITSEDATFRSAKPWFARFATGLIKPKYSVLGTEVAGVVAALGSGVDNYAVGDEIVADLGPTLGAYQEYVTVSADGVIAPKPTNLLFRDAVAMGGGFLTALPFLRDGARLREGQRILINGASGSVGSAAVQLARVFGAHVTGVCSRANVDLVRSLGADAVIDYGAEDFTATGETYDAVFDAVGKSSFSACKPILTENGIYLSTVPSIPLLLHMALKRGDTGKRARVLFTGLNKPEDRRADLHTLAELHAGGQIHPVIDQVYPLAEIREAHAYVDTGHKQGNVVVTMPVEDA